MRLTMKKCAAVFENAETFKNILSAKSFNRDLAKSGVFRMCTTSTHYIITGIVIRMPITVSIKVK